MSPTPPDMPRDERGYPDYWATVDFIRLAKRYNAALTALIHDEPDQRSGDDLIAEALRRALDGRHLRRHPDPYGQTIVTLVPETEVAARIELAIWSANAERDRAAQRTAEILDEYHHHRASLTRALADELDASSTERTVPAKLRREGIRMAANGLRNAAAQADARAAKSVTDAAVGPAPKWQINAGWVANHAAEERYITRRDAAFAAAMAALIAFDAAAAVAPEPEPELPPTPKVAIETSVVGTSICHLDSWRFSVDETGWLFRVSTGPGVGPNGVTDPPDALQEALHELGALRHDTSSLRWLIDLDALRACAR